VVGPACRGLEQVVAVVVPRAGRSVDPMRWRPTAAPAWPPSSASPGSWSRAPQDPDGKIRRFALHALAGERNCGLCPSSAAGPGRAILPLVFLHEGLDRRPGDFPSGWPRLRRSDDARLLTPRLGTHPRRPAASGHVHAREALGALPAPRRDRHRPLLVGHSDGASIALITPTAPSPSSTPSTTASPARSTARPPGTGHSPPRRPDPVTPARGVPAGGVSPSISGSAQAHGLRRSALPGGQLLSCDSASPPRGGALRSAYPLGLSGHPAVTRGWRW
jgi:hypothetical protein